MIINIDRLEQLGYRVERNGSIITIEPDGAVDAHLAKMIYKSLNLPPRDKENLVDEFITKVNNTRIIAIINEEY